MTSACTNMPAELLSSGRRGVAQREKEQNTRSTKRTQKAQKGPHTAHFLCFLCSDLCFLCSVPVSLGRAGRRGVLHRREVSWQYRQFQIR
jgi:hypothetical protein